MRLLRQTKKKFVYFRYRNDLFILAMQIYINAIQQKNQSSADFRSKNLFDRNHY